MEPGDTGDGENPLLVLEAAGIVVRCKADEGENASCTSAGGDLVGENGDEEGADGDRTDS